MPCYDNDWERPLKSQNSGKERKHRISFFWTLVAMICQRESQLTSRAHLRSRLGENELPIRQLRAVAKEPEIKRTQMNRVSMAVGRSCYVVQTALVLCCNKLLRQWSRQGQHTDVEGKLRRCGSTTRPLVSARRAAGEAARSENIFPRAMAALVKSRQI